MANEDDTNLMGGDMINEESSSNITDISIPLYVMTPNVTHPTSTTIVTATSVAPTLVVPKHKDVCIDDIIWVA